MVYLEDDSQLHVDLSAQPPAAAAQASRRSGRTGVHVGLHVPLASVVPARSLREQHASKTCAVDVVSAGVSRCTAAVATLSVACFFISLRQTGRLSQLNRLKFSGSIACSNIVLKKKTRNTVSLSHSFTALHGCPNMAMKILLQKLAPKKKNLRPRIMKQPFLSPSYVYEFGQKRGRLDTNTR